jgi:hypothetical protein
MRLRLAVAVLVCLALAGGAPAQPQAMARDKAKPKALAHIPGYKKQALQGFTLLVNDAVYEHNDDPLWRRKPLDVLDLELGNIVRRLPEKHVQALQRLLVWVEWEDRSDPDLARGVVAKYYGVSGGLALWSLGKGKHPLKANNVEIINMRSLAREHQPGVKLQRCVLLHEMAHAVHHQVLGFKNPNVRAVYRLAMARGLYNQATDVYGRVRKPPYAARNEHEYFAELTCAYLDRLHYYPFNADDLKKHDPAGYRLMEMTWGTRKAIEAAVKAKTEKEAQRKLEAARRLHVLGKTAAGALALEGLLDAFPGTKAAATAKGWLQMWKEEEKKEEKKEGQGR